MDDKPATHKFVKDEISKAVGIMLEKMDDNNRLIMEVLVPMKKKVDRIPKIEADIIEIRQDLNTIKTAMKATNIQVHNHEHRITRLEARPT